MGIKILDNLSEKVKNGIGISLNEGFEMLRRKRQQNKDTRQAHDRKEFPIHYSKPEDSDAQSQKKFLQYALSLIKKEFPLYWHILTCRMKGMSCKQLSKFLNSRGYNTTEAQLSKAEAQAMRVVKETIERIKRTGTPIFEGPEPKGLILPAA